MSTSSIYSNEDCDLFCTTYHILGKAFGECVDIPPETFGHAIGALKRKGKFQAIEDKKLINVIVGFIDRDNQLLRRAVDLDATEAEVITGFKKGLGTHC